MEWPTQTRVQGLTVGELNLLDSLPQTKRQPRKGVATRADRDIACRYRMRYLGGPRTEEQRQRLLDWILTAKTFMHVEEWKQVFKEVGYTGDYYWFILE